MPDKFVLLRDEKGKVLEIVRTKLEHIPLTKQEEAKYAHYDALGKYVSEQQEVPNDNNRGK